MALFGLTEFEWGLLAVLTNYNNILAENIMKRNLQYV